MRARLPRHGTIVAYIALIVAMSGTAYATVQWTSENIVDGSLTSADVADGSLTGTDIANGSIGAADLQSGSGSTGATTPFVFYSAIQVGFTDVGCAPGTYKVRMIRGWGDTSAVTIGGCYAPIPFSAFGLSGEYLYAPIDPLTGLDLNQYRLGEPVNSIGSASSVPSRPGLTLPGSNPGSFAPPVPFPGWALSFSKAGTITAADALSAESNILQIQQATPPTS